MAVPWLAVGKLVLNNLDTIIGVVKPGFTRKKVDGLPSQTDLLNQQIAELQAAASSNAEQIKQLAAQVKEVVAALAQAGDRSGGATCGCEAVVLCGGHDVRRRIADLGRLAFRAIRRRHTASRRPLSPRTALVIDLSSAAVFRTRSALAPDSDSIAAIFSMSR